MKRIIFIEHKIEVFFLLCEVVEFCFTHSYPNSLNPFVPDASFLYPLKISENLTVFLMFSGSRERDYLEQMG